METLAEKSLARNQKQNKIEQIKALKSIDEAFVQLQQYAASGYESIPKEDKEFFFKCFGIFDKKETPNQFMMRVRVPGGQLTAVQAETIGLVAREYGRDYMDITTRMQIELRYLKIEDIPAVIATLRDVGLTTYQTGIDNFRNIVGDPLDGMAHDNVIPSQPILLQMQQLFLEQEEWIGTLPRKFNIGILGSMSNRCNIYGQDCAYVLAQKEGRFGFNVYLGGKVGEIARDADLFVAPEEVCGFMLALAKVYKAYGFRDNRNKNRLFYLIQENGMEQVADAIRTEAGNAFATRGIPCVMMEQFDPEFGKVVLKDGTFAVHMVIPSGIFTGTALMETARASGKYGSSEIRLTVEQKLYILGVPEANLGKLLGETVFREYQNVSSPYFNNIIACAGTEHCSFGVIPNKPDAIDMAAFLSREVPLREGKVRMYWSACPKGCGLHGVGDIGFEGCKAKEGGESVHGVHIYVGGKITAEGREGRSVLKSVPLNRAKYMVRELLDVYRFLKRAGESFERFDERVLSRYTTGALGFLMRYNALCEESGVPYKLVLVPDPATAKNERFEIFSFGEQLYKKITESKPYDRVIDFQPAMNQTPLPPARLVDDLPPLIDRIVYKMIHPLKSDTYQVFSEILTEMEA